MTISLTCFKAYDIRGELGSEITDDIAYRIGRAYSEFLNPRVVILGGDIRLTSESLKLSLSKGLRHGGCNVVDIGMVGTEMVYFATSFLNADGGIEVTASHNPINFNGMKLVKRNSRPISSDTGLIEIKMLAEKNKFPSIDEALHGTYSQLDIMDSYINHILSYVNLDSIAPMRLVLNSGNGCAGPVIDALEKQFQQRNIPLVFDKINNKPDGSFPNGIPNPILIENRESTISMVKEVKADLGIAWDGDFDRCFLVDETGRFIEGYYIVGLLAESFLTKHKGAKIIHDPRLTWNTLEIVEQNGGTAIQSKTGHAFIKEKMRQEDAIYGGEMSAHHYFKDFFFCDSGMIPWLLIIELMSKTKKSLSSLVDKMITNYPSAGEINFRVKDQIDSMNRVLEYFQASAVSIDYTDGISMEFIDWRFNIRGSNTEPLLRLNIESKANPLLLDRNLKKITDLITPNSE